MRASSRSVLRKTPSDQAQEIALKPDNFSARTFVAVRLFWAARRGKATPITLSCWKRECQLITSA
jgi:hypothetical protein